MWSDGSRTIGGLVEGATTKNGHYRAPQVLRLTVKMAAEPGSTVSPVSLEVSSKGSPLVIRVEA